MPASPPETRASLILRLQNAGDIAAWDEFVELYGAVLFRVARRRGMQAADADNLVQEVLLKVAESISQWIQRTDRGSFRAWLLRIAHNEAVDMLTQRSTRCLGHDGEVGRRLLEDVSLRDNISLLIDHATGEVLDIRPAFGDTANGNASKSKLIERAKQRRLLRRPKGSDESDPE